jgi:hygromycin-B 4-O-kinase
MSNRKPKLTQEDIQRFLSSHTAGAASSVSRLAEGEESQAFAFEQEGLPFVIRINRSAAGFHHDAYARSHFHTAAIPIPNIIEIGQIDAQHAFCITERMPGFTLQDADEETITRLLKPVTDTWQAIRAINIRDTTGFGEFDLAGQGRYPTWRAFLLALFDFSRHDWKPVFQHFQQAEKDLFSRLTTIFTVLAQSCPEERQLIHGDFGANNLLTDGQRVTAVLDWENAKYGDPLFDIATAYFWRTWLPCMDLQAAYYQTQLASRRDYDLRIQCYQLYIGLRELYDTIHDGDLQTAAWVIQRCTEVLG